MPVYVQDDARRHRHLPQLGLKATNLARFIAWLPALTTSWLTRVDGMYVVKVCNEGALMAADHLNIYPRRC